jgi:Tol biopolymer transport system component
MRIAALGVLAALFLGACGGDDEVARDSPHLAGPATLLFAASEGGGSWDIYVEDVASGERTNLTGTPRLGEIGADDRSPVLSPDGSLIAHTSTADNVSEGDLDEEIFVMARDGSNPRRLTQDDDVDVQPQWTPAGRIMFTTCASSQDAVPGCALDLIWPNGTGRRTAFESIGLAVGVALAPGGDRIAYAGLDEMLQPRGLFTLDLESDEPERLADGFGPQWSPDGERIAFLSARDDNGPCLAQPCVGPAAELYVVDADGSDERRLTETTAQEAYAGWTPDGEWVLFSRLTDVAGAYDLYAVRVDGECEVQLTDTEASESSPSWIGRTDSLDCGG